MEYLAENLNKTISYAEYIAEHLTESLLTKEEKIRRTRIKKLNQIFDKENG